MGSKGKIVAAILLIIILIGTLWFMQREDRYNWYSEMDRTFKSAPYGTLFLERYLKTQFEEDSYHQLDSTLSIELTKHMNPKEVSNYVFIGQYIYLDSADFETSLQYVEQGNNMFFFSHQFPYDLMEYLNQGDCYYSWEGVEDFSDSLVYANLEDPELRFYEPVEFAHFEKDEKKYTNWPYLSDLYFCEETDSYEVLGNFNVNQPNFFRVEYGEGYFYFHTNPKFYTNYYFTTEPTRNYIERSLRYIDGDELLFDNYTRLSDIDGRVSRELSQGKGPLRFILSQESLKWGLYVLLGALFLFLVLESKRKQRNIPILVKKENTSIEYVETISELFFQRSGNGKIFKYMNQQFLEFIRKRYRMPTKVLDEKFITTLSAKSKIEKIRLEEIFKTHQLGQFEGNVSEEFLVKYHKKIQYFYNNCK